MTTLPDELCLGAALHLHQLALPLVQPVDAVLAVVDQQLIEADHRLLLDLHSEAGVRSASLLIFVLLALRSTLPGRWRRMILMASHGSMS